MKNKIEEEHMYVTKILYRQVQASTQLLFIKEELTLIDSNLINLTVPSIIGKENFKLVQIDVKIGISAVKYEIRNR